MRSRSTLQTGKEQLELRTRQPRPPGAVTAGEFADDLLAFIARQYGDRKLEIEIIQLALSNVAPDAS